MKTETEYVVHDLRKKIDKLEKQIEKMKTCHNCAFYPVNRGRFNICKSCTNYDKWELNS